MNYFDIGILAVVVLGALIGFSKGFSKSLASLFGWLVSIALAALFAKTVAASISDTAIVSKYFFNNPGGFSFADWIYGILPKDIRIDMNTIRSWVVTDGKVVPNAADILVEKIKDQHSLIGLFMGIFKTSYMETIATPEMLSYNFENLAQALSLLLANSLLIFFTGIVLLLIFKIITTILIKIVEKSMGGKNEKISFLSRVFGMMIGTVKGVLTCALLFVGISFAINFPLLSTARNELFEKDSIVAAKFATTIFEYTDKLLEVNDINIVLENSGYEATVDLSAPPGTEPQNLFV